MNINKFRYKVLSDTEKIYLDMTTLEIRQKLNMAFINPTAEDDMTGIFGKYYKLDKIYTVKYIYSRNRQLQPMTYDRYLYLLDVGEDEKGAYVEYTMVFDKLYDPLIRLVYILAVCAVLGYLFYAQSIGAMNSISAIVLGVIVAMSTVVMFKKSKENVEDCRKAEKFLKKVIKKLNL